MKNIILIIIMVYLFIGCTPEKRNDSLILKVDLQEIQPSLNSLFQKSELLALETNETNLLKKIDKLIFHNGKVYLFDLTQNTIFIFDNNGKYQNKIAKIGQGPGEYTLVYDFTIDELYNQIAMLCPFGMIYLYDLNTDFVKKIDLDTPPHNYQRIENFDNNHFVLWSFAEKNENAINIISKKDGSVLDGFWNEDGFKMRMFHENVFYRYADQTYLTLQYPSEIYKITKSNTEIAYSWDFGKDNLNFEDEIYLSNDTNMDSNKIFNLLISGEIPYVFLNRTETSKYYYTQLFFSLKFLKNVFYNKSTHESIYFEKTQEGFTINPLLMNDEYLISELKYEEKDLFLNSDFLSAEDKEKLKEYKEDDNPWLVKYYFN